MLITNHDYCTQKSKEYSIPPCGNFDSMEELKEAYQYILNRMPEEYRQELDLFIGKLQFTHMRYGSGDGLYLKEIK